MKKRVEEVRINKDKKKSNYAIVFNFQDSGLKVDFIKINKKSNIQDDFMKFNPEEKKLFSQIQNLKKWKEPIDFSYFFNYLQNSNFSLLYKKNNEFNDVVFAQKKLNSKIRQLKNNPAFPQEIGDLIFEIADENIEDVFFADNRVYIFTKENIVPIYSNVTNIQSLLNRVFKKKYLKTKNLFSQIFQSKFDATEILLINDFIKEFKKIFILETEFENYHIEEVENKKKELEIKYSYTNNFVEITPYLNYKIKRIAISESIKLNTKNDNNFFERKYNDELGYKYFIKIEKNNIIWSEIDVNEEISFFKELFALKNELGFTKRLTLKRSGLRPVKKFLEENWKHFKNLPFYKFYIEDKIDFESVKFRANFNIDLNTNKRDLNLKADFYLGQLKISIDELKKFSKTKNSFIRKEDGSLLKIENEKDVSRLLSVLNNFREKKEKGEFEGKLYYTTELKNIFSNSEFYKTKIDDGYKSFLEEAKNKKLFSEIEIPKKHKGYLREYQIDGLEWLVFLKKYHFGGILADEMGLGKTIQTLALLGMEKQKKIPSIVICPKTLINNWKDEAEKFTPDLKTLIVDGNLYEREDKIKNINQYDLILTSYSLFQRDSGIYKEENIKFNYAILDEAQYIKNFRTKNAVVVKEIDSMHRLALSGTPLENSIQEIWSIFEFLMPGFLGNFGDFTRNFIGPIMKGDKKQLSVLQEKISFFMLRRNKKDVAKELPEKIEQLNFIDLSDEQKILYNEVLSEVKKDFSDLSEENYKKSYMHILAALTRLRQICNHPSLLLKDNYKKYQSGKLNYFNILIDEIISENRKVLVFSQFVSMLNILEEEIQAKNISYSRLDGSSNNRNDIIKDFNENPKKQVFLISLKAGGVGINLTSADSVIIFDPWWNPSVENQAIDRTHRIGQKKSVNVYKLITKNSIEEQILKLQQEKASLFDALVNTTDVNFKKIEWKDIKNIFEL